MAVYLLKVADIMLPNGESIFQAIKYNHKTVETRANSPKYQDIKIWDRLVFESIDSRERIERIIIDIRYYSTIEQIFVCEDFDKIMPGVKSIEQAKKIYYSFPGYKKKIEKYGIVALEMRQFAQPRVLDNINYNNEFITAWLNLARLFIERFIDFNFLVTE